MTQPTKATQSSHGTSLNVVSQVTAPGSEAVASRPKRDWLSRLERVAQLGLAVATAGVVAGLFGRWSYLCDLASHFRCQYAVLLLVFGAMLALTRVRLGLLAVALSAVLLAGLIPYVPRPPSTHQTTGLRVVSMNVLFVNQQYDDVIRYLRQQNPDLVVLVELTPGWLEALNSALSDYRFRSFDSQHPPVGVAVFSRMPIRSKRMLSANEAWACTIETADQSRLRLIAAHTPSPMTWRHWMERNKMFRQLGAEIARDADQPRTLLLGDLNCTPWSVWFHSLLQESGLRDSAIGHGLWPTWYALPTILAGIPIDHALVGGQIEVLQRHVGPYLGSDHRPLTIDFRIRTSDG